MSSLTGPLAPPEQSSREVTPRCQMHFTGRTLPNVLFREGRQSGATVGYAHFDGSMKHSTLPMDLALGSIQAFEAGQVDRYRAPSGSGWCTAFPAELRVA